MKKFGKIAATVMSLAAVVGASLALTACGGGAEALGTYTWHELNVKTESYGENVASYVETMTLYSDNTFSATANVSSDILMGGASIYKTVSSMGYTGTYEFVSEDTELGEKTYKITDITSFWHCDGVDGEGEYVVYEKGNFPNGEVLSYLSKATGSEFVVTNEFKLSTSIVIAGTLSA